MKHRRSWIGGALALLILAGVWWGWARPGPGDSSGQSATTYAESERKTLEIVAEAAGLVEPIRVVEVKSRASGEVLKVPLDTGDVVEQGTLLAEIDPRDVQNAFAQAAADLEAARVQREIAESNRKRLEALKNSASATQQEFESAVQASASARAAVVRAETNLQLARERRNDVIIRAPVAGTILSRSVQPGQIIASATSNVSGGTTLFTMADLSQMQVRAKVDETDIGKIVPGQAAQVTVEAYPNRTFQGTVHKIEPQAVVEQNVTMFPVLVRLPNPEGLLRPGMNAEVRVQIARRENAISVPNSAIVPMRNARSTAAMLGLDEAATRQALQRPEGQEGRTGDARPAVVFVQAGGKLEGRRVIIGLSDWENTEVLSGLQPGEKVVIVSATQMKRQQQENLQRFRERTGGMMGPSRPSSGGGAGPRGRGGG